MKKIITIIFTLILAITFISCNENDRSIKRKADSQNGKVQDNSETSTVPTFKVDVIGYRMATDMSLGKKAVVIEYSFSHNSPEPLSFYDIVEDVIYQKGIECPRSRASFKDVDNQSLYIKVYADTQYSLKIAYYIHNDIEPVDILCTNKIDPNDMESLTIRSIQLEY